MKKILSLLLVSPLLMGLGLSPRNDNNNIFAFNDLSLDQYNSLSIEMSKTNRGVKIDPAENYQNTDAFIRFKGLNDVHEVSVQENRYLSIRYRSNYDPGFAIRILSTTVAQTWNDFLFSESTAGEVIDSYSYWHTVTYDLSFAKSSGISESGYNTWIQGDYSAISLNIVNKELFNNPDSFIYISSFSFFSSKEEAVTFTGLDYSSYEDTTGPVIEVEDSLFSTEGKEPNFSASYFDEYDGFGGIIEPNIPHEALDADGRLIKGNYELTYIATDLSGNVSNKTVSLVVGDRDIVAPRINLETTKIYIPAGAYNNLVILAYDEIDGERECSLVLSSGALNEKGQFLVGNHTLTIIATDLTGNVTTIEVEIIVGYDINPNGLEFIDEGETL